ncbi:MAG: hypothetical protein ACLQVY_25390 [Limisphaerales bacterium]
MLRIPAKWLFLVSGLVPLLGLFGHPPDPMLLIYSVFVLACFCRRCLAAGADTLPGPTTLRVVASFWLSGSLTEALAWLNNYLKGAAQPALFHPQLLADLLIGLGFYGGWAAAWLIACRWFRFTLAEAFIITGLQGIFFEQLGAVFLAAIKVFPANPPQAVLLCAYVFLVHGAAAGVALAPVLHQMERAEASRSWARFALVVAGMVALAFLGCWLIGAGSLLFGGLPPKRSIIGHPLW